MTETAGLGPLDRPGTAVPMPAPDTLGEATATLRTVGIEVQESYFQLVWRRFRRSKIAIVGGLMVIALYLLAIFANFFSPNPLRELNMAASFTPPTRLHFMDAEGNFHLVPFVYGQVVTVDMKTFEPTWEDDTSVMYPLQLFPKGWEYKILGFIPADRHLFGVEAPGRIYLLGTDRLGRDLWGKSCEAGRISLTMALFGTLISVAIGSVVGVSSGYYGGRTDMIMQRFVEFVNAFPQLPLWMALAAIIPRTWDSFRIFIIMSLIFALLSWTTLAREVRGKVLAYRESDFVLAAKEMGASDRRIIFRHLYPEHAEPHHRGLDADHPRHHPGRSLPELPGHRHPGAADQLGPVDAQGADDRRTGHIHLDDDAGALHHRGGAGLQLPWGRPARCRGPVRDDVDHE